MMRASAPFRELPMHEVSEVRGRTGDRAALQWTFVGMSKKTGETVEIRGRDLFQYELGKIKVRDAFHRRNVRTVQRARRPRHDER